ncbi:MAG TPA: aldose epimerase family protein [Solirubrobacteraceae bacterium]|jgi:aldose 1-epimerase|nr:aldose epimerase family protein [Solirubrobacteraceae bacterium]
MQHAFRGSTKLFAFFSTCALISFAVFAANGSAHALAKKGHHRHGHHHGNGGVTISSQSWGNTGGLNPQNANLYTLTNSNGMKVNITNFGGVVQSIWVPDKKGGTKDVVLGFPKLTDYVNDFEQGAEQTSWPLPGGSGDTYFGAIIGRYANRIANASFSLNNKNYTLDANNGTNTLHGGFLGWNTAVWSASTSEGSGFAALALTNTFPAGEGCDLTITKNCTGFPASVTATVTYFLTSDNQLKITYKAVNNSSSDNTVINLTNHSYFNLGGEASGSVFKQDLQIDSNQYTPVDTNLIPSSPFFVNVKGTAYDFRNLHPIGQMIRDTTLPDGGGQAFPQLVIAHGYDNNWVLNGSGYRQVSTALDPKTGIVLRTFTDQPGVQFYSGNFLVGDLQGTSGHVYRQTDGFTLETQHYPDAPHHIGDPAWPSVVLNAGGTFNSTTAYAFGVAGGGNGHGHQRH